MIETTKAQTTQRGRKRALGDLQIAELALKIKTGHKKAKVAREFGISRETLYKYLRAL
jgi:DNA-binding phage protein